MTFINTIKNSCHWTHIFATDRLLSDLSRYSMIVQRKELNVNKLNVFRISKSKTTMVLPLCRLRYKEYYK